MQKEHPPIKRIKELAELSREHHDGLHFVCKIKQGIAYGIPEKRIGKYCEWFWQNNLREHFKKEEAGLSTLLPKSDPLLNTMIEDHQIIVEKIEQVIDDPTYYQLRRLAQIIYYHIRFEERNLFARITRLAPAEKLEEAARLLSTHDVTDTLWPDQFWIKQAAVSAASMH
jgi:hypothetical protein